MLNSKKTGLLGRAIAVLLAAFMLTIGAVTAFAGSQMLAVASTPAVPATLTPAAQTPAASVATLERTEAKELDRVIAEPSAEVAGVANKPAIPAVPTDPKVSYKQVEIVYITEDEAKALDTLIGNPYMGKLCRKCWNGSYIVDVTSVSTEPRPVSCVHFARGDDTDTVTAYTTRYECDRCQYSYCDNGTTYKKIDCGGWS